MNLYVLAYYIFTASAQYIEYNGVTPEIGGTRQITIGVNRFSQYVDQQCRMIPRNNHRYMYTLPRQNYSRYYIKKRVTVGAGNPRFQFIATRIPIENDHPPGAKAPNTFISQLAVIYCEKSVLSGLQLFQVGARDCGIEEILVTFCLNDPDVNLRPEHLLQVDWDIRHTYLDLQQIFLENPMGALPFFENECKRFALFKISTRYFGRITWRRQKDLTTKYLRGSFINLWEYTIPPFRCQAWESYEIRWLLLRNANLNTAWNHNLDNRENTWYLCSTWDRHVANWLEQLLQENNVANWLEELLQENNQGAIIGPNNPGANPGNNQGPNPDNNPGPSSSNNPGPNQGNNRGPRLSNNPEVNIP